MADINVKVLAEQLDAAQAILDEIRVTCGCSAFGPRREDSPVRAQTALAAARKAYRDRQSRAKFIGSSEIFGEMAWDMLLDLFIKQTEREEVAIKSATLGSEGPASTEVRWLQILERHGLIAYHSDPEENACRLVHLTPTGYEGMLRYLESIAR